MGYYKEVIISGEFVLELVIDMNLDFIECFEVFRFFVFVYEEDGSLDKVFVLFNDVY